MNFDVKPNNYKPVNKWSSMLSGSSMLSVVVIALAANTASAQSVIYTQDFPGANALSDVNWSALAGSDDGNVDASSFEVQAGIAGGNYGFINPTNISNLETALTASPALIYTNVADIQVDVTTLSEISFDYIGDPTNASFRVALQIGGQWYAQSTAVIDSRDNPGAGGTYLTASFEPADFTVASNWLEINNATVGSVAMSSGSTSATDLSGTVQGLGLFLEGSMNDHMRFDNYSVSAVPESSVFGFIAGAAALAVVVARRRR